MPNSQQVGAWLLTCGRLLPLGKVFGFKVLSALRAQLDHQVVDGFVERVCDRARLVEAD